MNREQVIEQLKDLLFNFENFEEVETKEKDVQALEYAIKELERTAQEVPVQEQFVKLLEGITLSKWEQLKNCIDREFKSQSNQLTFKLSDSFKKNLKLDIIQ